MQRIIFLALLFSTYISSAQLSEETRQIYCQNNRDAIARLEKQIPEKKKELGGVWTKAEMDKAKKDSTDLASAIREANRFPLDKKDKSQSDREYLTTFLEPVFDMEKTYTGVEKLGTAVSNDFGDQYKLSKALPEYTQARLRVIRDSVQNKMSRQRAARSKTKTIEQELYVMDSMMRYHHNRIIELKCDEDKKTTNNNNPPPPKVVLDPPKPSTIELTEVTPKYGTTTITLKKVAGKEDIYEGYYKNGQKATFMLKQFTGELFDLQRIDRTYLSCVGTMNGNSAKGTRMGGGTTGTFTATF